MAGKKENAGMFRTVSEILRFAIRREEEAARAYGELAVKATDAGLKTILLELQADEFNHKELLQEAAEGKPIPLIECEVPDLKISDYLIEEPLGADSRFQDILIFAAKKEGRAAKLYARLLDLSSAPEHKRLFRFLVRQEKQHKLRLEQEYEKQVLPED